MKVFDLVIKDAAWDVPPLIQIHISTSFYDWKSLPASLLFDLVNDFFSCNNGIFLLFMFVPNPYFHQFLFSGALKETKTVDQEDCMIHKLIEHSSINIATDIIMFHQICLLVVLILNAHERTSHQFDFSNDDSAHEMFHHTCLFSLHSLLPSLFCR